MARNSARMVHLYTRANLSKISAGDCLGPLSPLRLAIASRARQQAFDSRRPMSVTKSDGVTICNESGIASGGKSLRLWVTMCVAEPAMAASTTWSSPASGSRLRGGAESKYRHSASGKVRRISVSSLAESSSACVMVTPERRSFCLVSYASSSRMLELQRGSNVDSIAKESRKSRWRFGQRTQVSRTARIKCSNCAFAPQQDVYELHVTLRGPVQSPLPHLRPLPTR